MTDRIEAALAALQWKRRFHDFRFAKIEEVSSWEAGK